jgi:outer membrane protein TolC
MHRVNQYLALICVSILLAPAAGAADTADMPSPGVGSRSHQISERPSFLGSITNPYRSREIPPVDVSNSGRLDSLLRAGKLYLSMQDAIALALENNLDIEIQRYGPQLADASVQRAEAGGFARGVSTNVTAGPTSASTTTGTAAQTGISGNAASQASTATTVTVGSNLVTQTGSAIPNLDPTFTSALRWAHSTTPQSSAFVTGTNSLIQRNDISQVAIQKGFLTGTNISLGLNNSSINTNNRSADFNPSNSSTVSLTMTQSLLQGFGRAVNSRQIRIARNNREISDLVFKAQVITTVAAVMNLYWDLVAFNEDVRVKKEALSSSEKLYSDNKKQVEIGTLAPIEVVRAEAEVASRQQDLTVSETRVLQQETILKNALSRTGVASPAVADAHIVATDPLRVPEVEGIQPIQDLMAMAISARPELGQSRIQVTNQQISIRGSKSALLPTVNAVVQLNNNGLAGLVNDSPPLPGRTRSNTPFFIGGWGSVLSQLFARNFPDYSLGFNLSIPLRNRAAQADLINDELTLRQQQLALQRQENQVRVDVQNAVIAVQQARAQYEAAVKGRILQEQTVDAEQKKYALGASTIYNVILTQRDLATAQSAEVSAMSTYNKAKVALDLATGQTLNNNNVSLSEAFRGSVQRQPSPIPDVPPAQSK